MADAIERSLGAAIASGSCCIGQIAITNSNQRSFSLTHRDEKDRDGLQIFKNPNDAIEIAKFDDTGSYRPLKTAPNLRHGWRIELPAPEAVRRALDCFYPGRLAALAAWQAKLLQTTSLRETLERQTGMYRVAARIADSQIDHLVGDFCRSDGGCLRTILWRRDAAGAAPSSLLPPDKFEPAHDQMGRNERAIPLLCQEACNLLVAAARRVATADK